MFIAAALITLGVVLLARHAARAPEGRLAFKGGNRVILWCGAIGPTLLLTALLVYSLPKMQAHHRFAAQCTKTLDTSRAAVGKVSEKEKGSASVAR